MSDTIKQFIESHRADDIVYALTVTGQKYFGLTNEQNMELHGIVFTAIDEWKARQERKGN